LTATPGRINQTPPKVYLLRGNQKNYSTRSFITRSLVYISASLGQNAFCFLLFLAWFLLFTSHEVEPRKLQLGCGNSSPAQLGKTG